TSDIDPDVAMVERHPSSGGTLATSTIAPAPLELATVMPSPVPHVTIEIRDTINRELVTAIEVLSPTNKRGRGRREYLVKRRHLLLSTVHLMEIDLLRTGLRVPIQQPLPAAPYFVFLSRDERRPLTEIWPIALSSPLPVVPVPLLPGDADVPLDLQAAFTAMYDLARYDLVFDYTQPPRIPLEGEAAAWAEARLREAGLR
ncbi:MAG: DUF4058 family protein, partial [Ardenticatenaceae bacterium]